MKLPSLLTSEAFGVVIKYAITGVATVCGLDPVMSMALGEGSAALLKDGKEAQQDKAIAIAEAVGAGAAKAFPVYQALPVKDQIGIMEGLAQVDDPQDLLNAPFVQAELAKLPNSQVRKVAESYVRALPDHVRRTLASQGDPAGRTATAQSIPKNAQEFGAAFAAIPSIYKAGDAVPHMPGWVLEAQLGGGGFGEVWRASKREMLRAVKFCKGGASAANLRIERDLVERVTKLARRTPGLVKIEDDFLDQQPPSLVYEFVQGCTLETHLKARIREDKPFAWGEAAGMILELAETMAVCHRESIIHRDLKPANILLDLDDPAEPRLRITDFGIGAALDQSTGAAFQGFTQSLGSGSARYAPPEQLLGGQQHPRDDIHALGIIWLQLIVSDLSEDQLDGPTRRRLLREGHPEPLIELLEDCIATKPAHRPESAIALAAKVKELLGKTANPDAARVRQTAVVVTPPPMPVLKEILAAMVRIDPGKVQRAQGGELRNDKAFAICKYPVTQAWYEAVIGSNPSHFQGNDKRPVEQVSWHDAQAFCQRLNELCTRQGVNQGQRFCLPSEAQWEHACRAGSPGDFGLLKNGKQGTVDELARYNSNSGDTTWPVGSRAENAWGLYDMHGNVWEWCEDPYDASPRVLRGGSWDNGAADCTAGVRNRLDPGYHSSHIGFRFAAVPA